MGIQHIIGILVLVCLGFGMAGTAAATVDDEAEAMAVMARGNNAFAADLYQHVNEAEGNVFFCPYSVRTALLMTFAGARGDTATQMARVLHIEEPVNDVHKAAVIWHNSLNTEQADYELNTANALWGQQGYGFEPHFVELLKLAYDGGLREVDFAHDVDAARQTINAWVEEHTGGKIVDFLKPQSLDASVLLVLTNSVYFKGFWEFPFDAEHTTNEAFELRPGETADVPMMSQTLTTTYGENDALQVVELPYRGERLSMVLVLPKERHGLESLEKQVTREWFEQLFLMLHPERAQEKVMVKIPRWSMEFDASLPGVLQKLGMKDAFALPPADFSGMTGSKDLYISDVLHKAVLDVNEEGTEAAAATEVTMSRGLHRPTMFVADHPFLVLIRDRFTDGVLFLGRVSDPRK